MCYRLGFVDQGIGQFGAELLVLQAGKGACDGENVTIELVFGNATLSAPIALLQQPEQGDLSTDITSPSFSSTINGQSAQLVGSFHFVRPLPTTSSDALTALVPLSVEIAGQGQVLNGVGTILVNTAGVSDNEAGFNATGAWGLFLASTAEGEVLVQDSQCSVNVVDVASGADIKIQPSSYGMSATQSTLTSSATPSLSILASAIATASLSSYVAAAVADNAASATTAPTTHSIAVLPIGLGVTAGAVAIGLFITIFVLWERRKQRRVYTHHRLEEQLGFIARKGAFRGPDERLASLAPEMRQQRQA